jgi:hypothetical protein
MGNNDINQKKTDIAVAVSRAVIGSIPVAGAALAEIISIVIPNQRMDRVADFVSKLEDRISDVEQRVLTSNKYFVDLLEDSILQATKSLSEERNEYIAIFLSKNREISEKDYSIKKKLLHILEEMTDEDVEILRSMRESWYQRTARNYVVPMQTIAVVNNYTKEEKYLYEMAVASWDAHINSLERLGLVRVKREIPHSLEQSTGVGHIDNETGLPKITDYVISDIGKVLLQSIED